DGFMTLGAKPDSGLGQSWDAAFPSLADADGDGLLSAAHGGLDPNDTTWDTDGDGLADSYEFQRRQDGVPFSPIQADSDGDGISDQAERQLAQSADPAKRVDEQGVPYNPIVVNTPPISVYTATDQRYVRPGQTLVYTTTVVAHDALAPSVLDVDA